MLTAEHTESAELYYDFRIGYQKSRRIAANIKITCTIPAIKQTPRCNATGCYSVYPTGWQLRQK